MICCEGDPKLIITDDGIDFNIKNGQPEMDTGLQNSIFLSLFTDSGWLGNSISDKDSENYNGEFMTIFQKPLSVKTALDAKKYAESALSWMVEEKIAKSITIDVEIIKIGFLGIEILIEQNENTKKFIYNINWAEMLIREGVL